MARPCQTSSSSHKFYDGSDGLPKRMKISNIDQLRLLSYQTTSARLVSLSR